MLYIFHVDIGQMTTYDMDLALKSVSHLKEVIERKTKIPASSIVLLVSGGEVLQSEQMVSSYSAGTDTNPIYMFSKPSVKDSGMRPSMTSEFPPYEELAMTGFISDMRSGFEGKSLVELRTQVELCRTMPATVNTVVTCANLAQQFNDLAHDVAKSCEQLVHEQHLQHQGWAAVVANLEDIYNEFCERSKNFKEAFKKHRLKKEDYTDQLNSLKEVLDSLGKIPILPALQLNAEAHRFSAFDVFEDADFDYYRMSQPLESSSENKPSQDFGTELFKLSEESVFEEKVQSSSNEAAVIRSSEDQKLQESDEGITFRRHSYEQHKEAPTLLTWILAQGNKASLQDILDYCQKGLDLIDKEPLKESEIQLCQILEYANTCGLKQIKGIEDRLYGLDQLLNDVRKLERDQHDQAASLTQYRERLNSAMDPGVLPTLVASHWCQLEKLLKGHQQLVDIKRRIAKSKDELSHILKARLETVLIIENSMSVQDAHAMLSFQCFNRLARYFDIVRQLQNAPELFVRAVSEVARRRTFSTEHLKWATDLSEKLLMIHEEEISRRQDFNMLFEGHFLKSLFPGLTDLPPIFATQAPPQFDARLPNLTEADFEYISTSFPELTKDIPIYDMKSTVNFFQQRLNAGHESADIDIQVDIEKDLESEAEVVGFEKLSSHAHIHTTDTSTTCQPDTMAVSTVTEDNMNTHKINMDKLQDFLLQLCGLCRANLVFIKEELSKIKQDMGEQNRFLKAKCIEYVQLWEKSNEEIAIKFREETQRMTFDHEIELSDMKNALDEKDSIINKYKAEKEYLKAEHLKEIERLQEEHNSTKDFLEETREEIREFERKLEELEVQKQKELKELQEKMHLEYKAEIESLRSRFRLVALTNMDRSPSESSLEKIERTDVIEISHHNAIVMQTKENAEMEKEEAIREALDRCEDDWRKRLEEEKSKFDLEKQAARHRLLSEKDRQIDDLTKREQMLVRELAKYKETIQQLTDPETNLDPLNSQIATLENEKALLQQEVNELKKELEKKVEEGDKSREDDSDGRSSPCPRRRGETRRRGGTHTPLGLAAGTLSLCSCLPGHTVLVLWDSHHLNYTVMQEATVMYFVHSECLPALDISIEVRHESERKLFAVAVVDSKEYCYAKKSGNRYNMPRGSRFYRVRVRPLKPALPPPSCCDHKHKPDISKSVDTSQSTSSNTDEARAGEVVTGTLINLQSPSEEVPESNEDQLDSIEASDPWHSRMQVSTATTMITSEMECSVGRCRDSTSESDKPESIPEPVPEVAPLSVETRGSVPPGSEVAEEATP